MKKAYIFPGQGSQFPGMAKELYDRDSTAAAMLDRANEILGFSITDVMFSGTADELKATRVTQPAVFLHSVCLGKSVIASQGVPDMVAGHSLGEFSALVAAGVLSFEDGLTLVAKRAAAMQKCCEAVPGAMAAIIGLPDETVEQICGQTEGIVVAANYNSEGQVVISGTKEAVELACAKAKDAGARRALPLAVSGAFHSPLMEPAREELALAIKAAVFSAPLCPVYQNVSAKGESDAEVIKENLLSQLTSPVRWTQTVRNMAADGAGSFLEIGPGAVLQGLVRRTIGGDYAIEGIS